MESMAAPLRRLHEEGAWFARAAEIRLLHVRTDATMRGAAVDLLMALEHHADNRALFHRFEEPFAGADRGWAARVQRLVEQHTAQIEAVAPAGIVVRPLGPGAVAAEESARGFSGVLYETGRTLGAPLEGVVVLLAPVRIEDPLVFRHELSALVASPQLGHVRWIVVEADGAAAADLVRALGPRALACECLVDENQQQDDLAASGVASVSDPPVALPVQPRWRAPGAMPDVAAPPRLNDPVPATDEQLRAAGLSPKFVNGGGDALKKLLLGAALALRQKRNADAVALQARAAALCAEMEMPREQILNVTILGGYLLAAGQRRPAREAYTKARDLAVTGAFDDLIAQTELALGMLDAVDRLPAEAAGHYATAGKHAEKAGIGPLAIECWRMAGQLTLEARLETAAVDCWKRALSIAEPMDTELAKLTSAPEVARALAAVCRKRGLSAQADQLEKRSVELEAGAAPAADKAAAS
ncbi:MAG TPA: hypothetical protein VHM31_06335 [Polyangia bacterium]|nr:hypothetical protein [Polyangia bacterium]